MKSFRIILRWHRCLRCKYDGCICCAYVNHLKNLRICDGLNIIVADFDILKYTNYLQGTIPNRQILFMTLYLCSDEKALDDLVPEDREHRTLEITLSDKSEINSKSNFNLSYQK